MLNAYYHHVAERAKQGIVPKPLNASQTSELVALLKDPPLGKEEYLMDLLVNKVPAGVDEASYVKCKFLTNIAKGIIYSPLINITRAVELLGTMKGGYNVVTLIELLDNDSLALIASKALEHTLLIFDNFYIIEKKAKDGNPYANNIIHSWARADWFLNCPKLDEKITLTVFLVSGETTTDDLSPAPDAWSRPDIPLHALTMLKNPREGIIPDKPGIIGPIKQIENLKTKGFPLIYVGDIVGTGSSRKSATNSLLWLIGKNIPYVPNKRNGGFCLASKIAPIFFNTLEDAGALPIEGDIRHFKMGDIIDLYPYKREIRNHYTNELLIKLVLKNDILLDEVRAGGRIPLIIGRNLTAKARNVLKFPASELFVQEKDRKFISKSFTLAQKIVGKACGLEGIHAGSYCEPKITSIGSQDTTGPMTRDELLDLACLKFSADLVMQSFCHTAAYPLPIDILTHKSLSQFIIERGGVSLHPGDGIIHSWLNRMILPDTVGTGGDSHTRFPIGISFPAGSGMVAFSATTGVMPMYMPQSVLVRFQGEIQQGITIRDLVHSIPLYATKQGLLTLRKEGKKNIFSGCILEIEGLSNIKVEQAFELTDASAERSASACTIQLDIEPVIEYITSNVSLLKWMISEGYGNLRTIEYRIKQMENWLKEPKLLKADKNAHYDAVIEINVSEIKEPILCVPNDPDDTRFLSELENIAIDEVFIGSCMTNIGHFRIAGKLLDIHKEPLKTRLWICPPTKMDMIKLTEEGYYNIFNKRGARIEIPGCSLCMGNQARVKDGTTVMSTSTRNFPNRLGTGANVYLSSAELAAVSSLLGRIPTLNEYMNFMSHISTKDSNIYNYLNFHQLKKYAEKDNKVIFQTKV